MTDDELNAAVAVKVMGWKRELDEWLVVTPEGAYFEKYAFEWNPCESIADAWRMEERILELKLWNKYVAALLLIKLGKETPAVTLVEMFNLIHATPRERTVAAVEAAKGAETK